MSIHSNWYARIEHMRFEIKAVTDFLKDVSYDQFCESYMMVHAVTRSVQIIGEAANKIPVEIREQYPDINWRVMIGMRNVLVHDYEDIDHDILWRTVREDLPILDRKLSAVIDPTNQGNGS